MKIETSTIKQYWFSIKLTCSQRNWYWRNCPTSAVIFNFLSERILTYFHFVQFHDYDVYIIREFVYTSWEKVKTTELSLLGLLPKNNFLEVFYFFVNSKKYSWLVLIFSISRLWILSILVQILFYLFLIWFVLRRDIHGVLYRRVETYITSL